MQEVKLNLPSLFVERMRARLGDEFEAFEKALEEPAPSSVRWNPAKTILEAKALPVVPWCAWGQLLPRRPSYTLDPLLHAGAYYVQEASSMFLGHVLEHLRLRGALAALDLCAAPGGKSTLLASALPEGSLLVANEVVATRAQILKENLNKWGSPNVAITSNQPEDFAQLGPVFDLMLVDAPCSGEGLFRKDPDAIGHWSPENLLMCQKRQEKILEEAWPALKEDGILIYSTCTYNPGENEQILEWLCENFAVEELPIELPEGWGVQKIEAVSASGFAFLPHRLTGEGFFLAVLRKTPGGVSGKKFKTQKKSSKNPHFSNKEQPEVLEWIDWDDADFHLPGESVEVFSGQWRGLMTNLRQNLHPLQLGQPLALPDKRGWRPDPLLSFSTRLRRDAFPRTELGLHAALTYLAKGETKADLPQGMGIFTFQDLPLGFYKQAGARVINHFPKDWRVRMDVPLVPPLPFWWLD